MSNIINLTPHAINVLNADNSPLLTLDPSGVSARCSSSRTVVGNVNGVTVNKTTFGDVSGLPDAQDDTFYIVSALVAQACPQRNDLLIVDDAVRDEAGRIIGCRAFARI